MYSPDNNLALWLTLSMLVFGQFEQRLDQSKRLPHR
jgi:hypothetical protein